MIWKDLQKMNLEYLNTCDFEAFVTALDGIYEETTWMAEDAFVQRPFQNVAALKTALRKCVERHPLEDQLALVRAHPELAGAKAAALALSQESTQEQRGAGLLVMEGDVLERLRTLNATYREKFGFPFVIAVRGPDGLGLALDAIVETLQRRLAFTQEAAFAESLEQIHLIAALRLNNRLS